VLDSLSNVASLREQNAALTKELAEAQAALVAVQDEIARLDLLEELYALDSGGSQIGRTVANVIGRPDGFDLAFVIDKGTSDGVVAGQPVVDTNGFVVGTITSAGPGSATVVPITVSREGVTVLVGAQVGTLLSQPASSEMRLQIIGNATEPVLTGDRVITSASSVSYPAGLAVGEVAEDVAPVTNSIVARVRPFVDPETLRLVIVLAWPPDPISAATDEPVTTESTTTTTLATSTSIEGS
jgi:rod shape-determining protein MreC